MAVASATRLPERVSGLALYDCYAQGAFRGQPESTLQRMAEALTEMIEVGWGLQTSAFRRVFAELLIPGASKEQQRWLAELQRRTVDTKHGGHKTTVRICTRTGPVRPTSTS